MPHMTVEYSANLDARVDMAAFCGAVRDAMLATGLFEVGAVRVRALRCEAYSIADGLAENAFVDMSLRMGQGRAAEARKGAGEAIFGCAREFFADLLKAPHFALSLEIREIDAELSWKLNTMHARLRGN